MELNKIKTQSFWESIAAIAVAGVFVIGGGVSLLKFSGIAFNFSKDKISANLEEGAKKKESEEKDKKLEEKKQELLKAETYSAPFLGKEDAEIEVEAFFDFGCPYSKIFFIDSLMRKVRSRIINGGKIKFVFRNYPSASEKSYDMAMTAACAGEQGRFWQMEEQLFNNIEEIKNNDLGFSGYANQIGLNMNLFEYCMTNKKYEDAILQDIARAEKMGISRVPMFAINGKIVKEGLPSENEVEEWGKR